MGDRQGALREIAPHVNSNSTVRTMRLWISVCAPGGVRNKRLLGLRGDRTDTVESSLAILGSRDSVSWCGRGGRDNQGGHQGFAACFIQCPHQVGQLRRAAWASQLHWSRGVVSEPSAGPKRPQERFWQARGPLRNASRNQNGRASLPSRVG